MQQDCLTYAKAYLQDVFFQDFNDSADRKITAALSLDELCRDRKPLQQI